MDITLKKLSKMGYKKMTEEKENALYMVEDKAFSSKELSVLARIH